MIWRIGKGNFSDCRGKNKSKNNWIDDNCQGRQIEGYSRQIEDVLI